MVISLTFVVQGGVTESLLNYLDVPRGVEYEKKKTRNSGGEDDLYVHGEGGFPGWMNFLLDVNRRYLLPSLTIPLTEGSEEGHSFEGVGGSGGSPRQDGREEESSGSDDGLIVRESGVGKDEEQGHDPSEIDIQIHNEPEAVGAGRAMSGGQEDKDQSKRAEGIVKYDDL